MVIFIEGKSGSGKDTVANKILSEYDIKRRVLYTTRPMRDTEIDGEEYNFISEYEFSKMIKEGKFLEYRYYYTAYGKWYYGTPMDDLSEDIILWGPKSMYIAILDNLSKLGKSDLLRCIYIDINGWTRLSRMLSRNSNLSKRCDREQYIYEVLRRYLADEEDFRDISISDFDLVVDNSGRMPISDIRKFLKEVGIKKK